MLTYRHDGEKVRKSMDSEKKINANEFLDKLRDACTSKVNCEDCVFFIDGNEKTMCRITSVLSGDIGVMDVTPVENECNVVTDVNHRKKESHIKRDSDKQKPTINIKNVYISICDRKNCD